MTIPGMPVGPAGNGFAVWAFSWGGYHLFQVQAGWSFRARAMCTREAGTRPWSASVWQGSQAREVEGMESYVGMNNNGITF